MSDGRERGPEDVDPGHDHLIVRSERHPARIMTPDGWRVMRRAGDLRHAALGLGETPSPGAAPIVDAARAERHAAFQAACENGARIRAERVEVARRAGLGRRERFYRAATIALMAACAVVAILIWRSA